MRDTSLDQLVLHYLRKRGLRDVEAAFRPYIRAQQPEPDDGMAVSQQAELQQSLIEDLASFAAENDAGVYTETYERLTRWVDNSLDMYRSELRRLLHPVFVRCYLQLLELDAGEAAAGLLARYRTRVLSGGGGLRRSTATDLQTLAALTSRAALRSSPLAAGLTGRPKAVVPLSGAAHELLLRFLHGGGPRMLPLLAIINGDVELQVQEGLPRGAGAGAAGGGAAGEEEEGDAEGWEGEDALADGGAAPADAASAVLLNRTEIKLGLLQGNVEDLYREQQQQEKQRADAAAAAAAAAGDAAGAAGPGAGGAAADGTEPPTKKARKAAEKAAAAAAAAAASRAEAVRAERIEHPPFLPRPPDDLVAACLRDISLRQPVSAATPPSCAFFTFVNAKQTLDCAAFSADGARIVAGFADSSVRLYDMQTISAHHARLRRSRPRPPPAAANGGSGGAAGSPSPPPPDVTALDDEEADPPGTSYMYGHTAAVHAVDFSADERLIFSGASDGSIRAWGAEFGACLALYTHHTFPVWGLACCPVGHWFASCGADRAVRLWTSERTAPLRLMAGHGSDVDALAWHPNATLLASGSADRTVRLWDVRDGKAVRYFSCGPLGAPTALALCPDGQHLAAGTDEGRIAVWDLAAARRLAVSPPPASHAGPVWALAYSRPDGAVLASGGADETVRLWRNDLAQPPETVGAVGSSDDGAPAADGAAGEGPGRGPGGGGGGGGGGPYGPVGRYRTKSSPVVSLAFTRRNLLLAAGPFHRRGPVTG